MDLGRNHANGSDMECQQNERSELMVVENFCVSFKPFDSAIANGGPNGVSKETSIIFSLPETVGGLAEALTVFKKHNVVLRKIESRPSKCKSNYYDLYIEIDQNGTKESDVKFIIQGLEENAENVVLQSKETVPWFPRTKSDLDKFSDRILSYGAELDADHPGFTDSGYRARRKELADIAWNYRHGQPLPIVTHNDEEIQTWNKVFTELTKLYPTHACKEVNSTFHLLKEECGYGVGVVPQLRDVSEFLKGKTGFTLRPVAGMLSSRDFLTGLAFRVFHATQYIRHGKMPMYCPEPDTIHELLGHVPMLADPSFAQYTQEIGLASLGVSDEWIHKLGNLYSHTVEFGLCCQDNELRAYGAGLTSAFGELQHALSDEAANKRLPFDPEKAANTDYPPTKFQPVYFVAESFEDAKSKVRDWLKKIPRPFTLYYNAYTEKVEILDNKEQILDLIADVKSNLDVLHTALQKADSL